MSTMDKLDYLVQNNTGDCIYNEFIHSNIEPLVNYTLGGIKYIKRGLGAMDIDRVLDICFRRMPKQTIKILMCLTGLSQEGLKRLFIDIKEDICLQELLNYDNWMARTKEFKLYTPNTLYNNIKKDENLRKGMINLYLNGYIYSKFDFSIFPNLKSEVLQSTFELPNAILRRLIYDAKRGQFSAELGSFVENRVSSKLNQKGISHEVRKKDSNKRNFDIHVPNVESSIIIIECSYLRCTACGQGDKPKSMATVKNGAIKFGIFDGKGWKLRRSDLKKVAECCDFLYTLSSSSLDDMCNEIKNLTYRV